MHFLSSSLGHGGTQVVHWLEKNLHKVVLGELQKGGDVKEALKNAFVKADQQIIDAGIK